MQTASAHSHERLDAASRQQRPPSLAPAMGAWATVQTAGECRHALLATTRHPYEQGIAYTGGPLPRIARGSRVTGDLARPPIEHLANEPFAIVRVEVQAPLGHASPRPRSPFAATHASADGAFRLARRRVLPVLSSRYLIPLPFLAVPLYPAGLRPHPSIPWQRWLHGQRQEDHREIEQ